MAKIPDGVAWRNFKRKAETKREAELLNYIEEIQEEIDDLKQVVRILTNEVGMLNRQCGEMLKILAKVVDKIAICDKLSGEDNDVGDTNDAGSDPEE